MRCKNRKINMDDGFTLVELLAVIVILGIIIAIAIPAVGGVIDKADSDSDKSEIELIKEATRIYVASEYDNIQFIGVPPQHQVPIYEGTGTEAGKPSLYDMGYLDNLDNDDPINGTVTIKKNKPEENSDNYRYMFEVDIEK